MSEPVEDCSPCAESAGLDVPSKRERLTFLFGVLCGGAAVGFIALLLLAVAEHHPRRAIAIAWVVYVGCFVAAGLVSVLLTHIDGSRANQ